MKRRVIIMGAAGRDFHNFNVFFRGNEDYEVVAFTATRSPESTTRNTPPNWPVAFIRMGSRSIRKPN